MRKTGYITIKSPEKTLDTSFSADVSAGLSPLSVAFTDTSVNNPSEWSWDFGDGNTSSEQNPTHTFFGGSYDVYLTTNREVSDVTRISALVAGGDINISATHQDQLLFVNATNATDTGENGTPRIYRLSYQNELRGAT